MGYFAELAKDGTIYDHDRGADDETSLWVETNRDGKVEVGVTDVDDPRNHFAYTVWDLDVLLPFLEKVVADLESSTEEVLS